MLPLIKFGFAKFFSRQLADHQAGDSHRRHKAQKYEVHIRAPLFAIQQSLYQLYYTPNDYCQQQRRPWALQKSIHRSSPRFLLSA